MVLSLRTTPCMHWQPSQRTGQCSAMSFHSKPHWQTTIKSFSFNYQKFVSRFIILCLYKQRTRITHLHVIIVVLFVEFFFQSQLPKVCIYTTAHQNYTLSLSFCFTKEFFFQCKLPKVFICTTVHRNYTLLSLLHVVVFVCFKSFLSVPTPPKSLYLGMFCLLHDSFSPNSYIKVFI